MDRNGEGMWSLKGTWVASLTTLHDVGEHREGRVVSDYGLRGQPPHPHSSKLGVAHLAMGKKAQAHRYQRDETCSPVHAQGTPHSLLPPWQSPPGSIRLCPWDKWGRAERVLL